EGKIHVEVESFTGCIRAIGRLQPPCEGIAPDIMPVKGTSNGRVLQHLSHRPAIVAGKDGIKLIRKKGIVSTAPVRGNAFCFVINGQSLRHAGWDSTVK